MQKARMQEMHERVSIFKECMPGMRGQHQDWTWWHEEGRRDILVRMIKREYIISQEFLNKKLYHSYSNVLLS
jgi:hypothetical protein